MSIFFPETNSFIGKKIKKEGTVLTDVTCLSVSNTGLLCKTDAVTHLKITTSNN